MKRMPFDATAYSDEVAAILALDGAGERLMPLAGGKCSSAKAVRRLKKASSSALFPGARSPDAALSGLWLYFSCLDESHARSQEIKGSDGSFWHGIMHRQEPDASNAAYWFRRVGRHPVFEPLHAVAVDLASAATGAGFRVQGKWDPFAFIDFCDEARRHPGSPAERLGMAIQRAEWQLLFDHCARH